MQSQEEEKKGEEEKKETSFAPPNVQRREDFRNVYRVSDKAGEPMGTQRRMSPGQYAEQKEKDREEERKRQQ